MKISDLSIGYRISIKVQMSDGTLSVVSYTSKIEEVLPNNQFLITSPTLTDMQRWIDKKIQLLVVDDTAVFSCFAKVVDQVNDNGFISLKIKITSDFIKEQRRNFYRLVVDVTVALESFGTMKSIDISGSGISIKMPHLIDSGKELVGSIDLKDAKVSFIGRVVRSQRISDKGAEYFAVCTEFIDMDPWDQEHILKFIHNQQVILRRKGLLFGKK